MKLIKLHNDYHLLSDENIEDNYVGYLFQNGDLYASKQASVSHTSNIRGNTPYGKEWIKVIASSSILEKELPLLDENEIEKLLGKVDVEKLAMNIYYEEIKCGSEEQYAEGKRQGFIFGYNKALKENADKKFTFMDMETSWKKGFISDDSKLRSEFIKELKEEKKEWDVEIEMEAPVQIRVVGKPPVKKPKLNKQGFVTITKINYEKF